MAISVFDLFKVGIGPSSSHTVGPMRAAFLFVSRLHDTGLLERVASVRCELFGSLGATGHGHGSVPAVVLGLSGEQPHLVDPVEAEPIVSAVRSGGRIALGGKHTVTFSVDDDVVLHRRGRLSFHSNGMVFLALDAEGEPVDRREYYSVGGGFVLDEDETGEPVLREDPTPVPHPFDSGDELVARARDHGLRISDVMLANEAVWRPEQETRAGLLHLWSVMRECVERGTTTGGVLPGGLRVRRRAPELRRHLDEEVDAAGADGPRDPLRPGRQRGERRRRPGGHRPHQRRGRHRARGPAPRGEHRPRSSTTTPSCASCSRPARSGCCSRGTRRSPAPRSGARARSARRARWPLARSPSSWGVPPSRSRTPPRSGSSTTWG